MKELKQFTKYYKKNKQSILKDYLKLELKLNERIVYQNESFVIVVPYWAIWPYETLIILKKKNINIYSNSRKKKQKILQML